MSRAGPGTAATPGTVPTPGHRLDGQRALVTGAAGTLGAQVALDLAAAGAQVSLLDVDAAGLDHVRDRIAAAGGHCRCVVADVTDPVALAQAGTAADILVTCAVVRRDASLLASTPRRWQQVTAVNIGGVLAATDLVAPAMCRQGYGRIVHVGPPARLDDGSLVEDPLCVGVLAAVVRSFAVRFAAATLATPAGPAAPGGAAAPGGGADRAPGAGVTVNCVVPRRPPGSSELPGPAEISAAVVFLASPAGGWINGQVIPVEPAPGWWPR